MNITVNQELLAYIDPLTADEREALERSLLAEGCRWWRRWRPPGCLPNR